MNARAVVGHFQRDLPVCYAESVTNPLEQHGDLGLVPGLAHRYHVAVTAHIAQARLGCLPFSA